MKFALISHLVPPSGTGQSLVLYRMLSGFDPRNYCLISTESPFASTLHGGLSEKLSCSYYTLPPPFRLERGHRFGLRKVREGVNVPLTVFQYARRIANIVRSEKCDAVMACTGETTILPAGYMASKMAGVPFFAYVFDHYSYREWSDPVSAFWARRFEPFMMKGAAGIITPNEMLRNDLRQRFGVEPTVIHNSFDISPYEKNGQPHAWEQSETDDVSIVYTGAVYEAHFGAFRNLMAALGGLKRSSVVHIYTNQPAETLERENVRGPIVLHPQQSMNEMPRVQMNADLLFLPLAFDSPYPDLVRTSATTKLGEYLAAGRPVLVHAPRDSFVSWYFREHECGLVVDEDEPARLAEGIERLLGDAELRRRLITNALDRARADFSIAVSRAAFARLLDLDKEAHA
jgi:glycosyltransferase involved in cell wall biosynthesis